VESPRSTSPALGPRRGLGSPSWARTDADIVYSFDPAEIAERVELWQATLSVAAEPAEWVRGDVDVDVRDEHSTFT
jgi:hypothetical protein